MPRLARSRAAPMLCAQQLLLPITAQASLAERVRAPATVAQAPCVGRCARSRVRGAASSVSRAASSGAAASAGCDRQAHLQPAEGASAAAQTTLRSTAARAPPIRWRDVAASAAAGVRGGVGVGELRARDRRSRRSSLLGCVEAPRRTTAAAAAACRARQGGAAPRQRCSRSAAAPARCPTLTVRLRQQLHLRRGACARVAPPRSTRASPTAPRRPHAHAGPPRHPFPASAAAVPHTSPTLPPLRLLSPPICTPDAHLAPFRTRFASRRCARPPLPPPPPPLACPGRLLPARAAQRLVVQRSAASALRHASLHQQGLLRAASPPALRVRFLSTPPATPWRPFDASGITRTLSPGPALAPRPPLDTLSSLRLL
jgi:hypothetical protein